MSMKDALHQYASTTIRAIRVNKTIFTQKDASTFDLLRGLLIAL